ncbi:MAG: hypothetical protein PHC61_08815 [Chitinivibrionales bacterium]|nr:hypothetical protein [Chitinivibrionales bacterium]
MEVEHFIRIIWIIVFFLFSITLIFVWSKVLIISKKIKSIDLSIKKIRELSQETVKTEQPSSPPAANA